MNVIKMKNIHLIILYFCFLFASLSSSYEINPPIYFTYCMKDTNKTFPKASIAYLSEQEFGSIEFNSSNKEYTYDIKYMMSVCVCRESFDTVFFTIPSIDYKVKDYVVLCVNNENSFASLGIYDTHELYDLLLSQRIENYPSSVLRAEQTRREDDEPGCFDFDGYPTKNIFGQKTCMFEAERHKNHSSSEYSGPLVAKVFYQFLKNLGNRELGYCFTTLNNSLVHIDSHKNGKCYFLNDATYSKVLCCCPYGSQNCRKRNDNLLCSHGEYPASKFTPHIEAKDFFNESIKGCTIQMTASLNQSTSNIELKASYNHQAKICEREVTTNSNETQICSHTSIKLDNLTMNGCCNTTNFCNFDILPPRVNIPKKCAFKPYIEYYFDYDDKCQAYFDLTLKQLVFVYDKFNCDLIESTKQHLNKTSNYELMFIKITKVDSKDCIPRNYNDTHLNKIQPFIRFNCNTTDCDQSVPFYNVVNSLAFKCQILKWTELKLEEIQKISSMVIETKTKDRWICYVKIEQRDGNLTFIEAGHLDVNDKPACMYKNINDSDYCCMNINGISQMDSTCNVETMLAQYEKALKQKSTTPPPYSIRNQNNIKCIMNHIANDDSRCPANDGCFETRNMDASSTYAEPAGCLGLAEEYILKSSPEASYSLACRSIENFGHCSVVYNPDGQQKIVCCCNQVNDNLCETGMAKVKSNIGRTIQSFHSVKT